MTKKPFRLSPYQVQFLIVVGFASVGYALYLRYLGIELSTVGLACDAGLQTLICKARSVATVLFNEGRDNWQSLWTCAMYLLFALTLWRARAEQIQE